MLSPIIQAINIAGSWSRENQMTIPIRIIIFGEKSLQTTISPALAEAHGNMMKKEKNIISMSMQKDSLISTGRIRKSWMRLPQPSISGWKKVSKESVLMSSIVPNSGLTAV